MLGGETREYIALILNGHRLAVPAVFL